MSRSVFYATWFPACLLKEETSLLVTFELMGLYSKKKKNKQKQTLKAKKPTLFSCCKSLDISQQKAYHYFFKDFFLLPFLSNTVPKSHPSTSGPWDLNSEKISTEANKEGQIIFWFHLACAQVYTCHSIPFSCRVLQVAKSGFSKLNKGLSQFLKSGYDVNVHKLKNGILKNPDHNQDTQVYVNTVTDEQRMCNSEHKSNRINK